MAKLNENINPKLTGSLIERLQQKHISTILEFVIEDSEKLSNLIDVPYKDICEIKQSISEIYGAKVKTAFDILLAEEQNILSTGIPSLDELLKGGFYPGQLYELCGVSASGKTQLCLTVAANIALNPNSVVKYIDTKGDFSGSRIHEILRCNKYSQQIVEETMDRIQVHCPENPKELVKVLKWLTTVLTKELQQLRTRLIIIDSLPGIIFQFSKDHDTTYFLNHLANVSRFLAAEFNLTVVTVNIITQWNPSSEKDVYPALGKYWRQVPNTRILIQKTGVHTRKLTVWKSCQLRENSTCTVNLSDSGIN